VTNGNERRSGAAGWPALVVGLAVLLAVPLSLVAFVVAGAATVLSTPDGGASTVPNLVVEGSIRPGVSHHRAPIQPNPRTR
jgi:hypothetical protein